MIVGCDGSFHLKRVMFNAKLRLESTVVHQGNPADDVFSLIHRDVRVSEISGRESRNTV